MLLTAAVGATLALAGCREDRPTPNANLLALPATEALPYGYAPAAYELEPARPARLGRLVSSDEQYAWAERGYGMDYAFYDTPPDYAVVYDDVQPWVWETDDDWILVLEPLSVGYRSYYYAPGYDRPFLVRDPECAYGYDNDGRLVAVYLQDGSVLQSDQLLRYDDVAGRYLYRGADLYAAARQPQRYAVAEPLWSQQRPTLLRAQSRWMSTAGAAPEWRAYRDRTDRAVLTRFREVRDERMGDRDRGLASPRLMRALAQQGARSNGPRDRTEMATRDARGPRSSDGGPGGPKHEFRQGGPDADARRLARDDGPGRGAQDRGADGRGGAPKRELAEAGRGPGSAKREDRARPDAGRGHDARGPARREALARQDAPSPRADRGPKPDRAQDAQPRRESRPQAMAQRADVQGPPQRPDAGPAPMEARGRGQDRGPQGGRPDKGGGRADKGGGPPQASPQQQAQAPTQDAHGGGHGGGNGPGGGNPGGGGGGNGGGGGGNGGGNGGGGKGKNH